MESRTLDTPIDYYCAVTREVVRRIEPSSRSRSELDRGTPV
jgi:hypothetical protein